MELREVWRSLVEVYVSMYGGTLQRQDIGHEASVFPSEIYITDMGRLISIRSAENEDNYDRYVELVLNFNLT